jgi:hypothetical protein
MTPPEPDAVDVRPLRPRLSSAALTLLDGALVGGLVVLAVPDRWEWLAALVVAVAVAILVLRGWRIGLGLRPSGLLVRNYWRSRHFAWDDVERLETGFRMPALRAPPALAVFPKRGRPFVVQASIRPSYREKKVLLAVVREHARAHDVPVVPAPPTPDHGWLGGVRRRHEQVRGPGRGLPF